MLILSSRRHASALLVYISCIRQVDLTHQVDFECPHVCNARTWHSPYLVHMAPTSMNRCPSACPFLFVAPGMLQADLHASIVSAYMIRHPPYLMQWAPTWHESLPVRLPSLVGHPGQGYR